MRKVLMSTTVALRLATSVENAAACRAEDSLPAGRTWAGLMPQP
jgi:hypothetical protein